MRTPLGDFLRARRDATSPASVGLAPGPRRRVPGLRRSELAALAGISVEYLIRIEQGGDRNPSPSVIASLAAALGLDADERDRLRHLATITDECDGPADREPGPRPWPAVRPAVLALLEQLEPAPAFVTDRLGDVLAHTTGFEAIVRPSGLLDEDRPNLTRYVFADPRARDVLPDWDRVADERAADLWLVRHGEQARWMVEELLPQAGAELSERVDRHPRAAPGAPLRWRHPLGELRLDREVLELPAHDGQQLVVLLPADADTKAALTALRVADRPLRAVS